MSGLRTDGWRRIRKGGMLAAVIALISALMLPTTAWGASKVTDTYGPEPPVMLNAETDDGEAEEQEPFYGYMPVEYPTRSIHDANEGGYGPYGPNRAITIPAYYDARTTGAIMPIRDQNPFGTCWSFSAIAASESSLVSHGLMASPLDFSERQLAYFTYNPVNDPLGNLEGDSTSCRDGYLDQGGNERLAAYTLATWSGAVDETLAPYSELTSASDPYALTLDASLSREHDSAHLVNMRQIPMTDRDDVKLAIMEYGALDASVFYSDQYLNTSTNAYYCADTTGTNHAVPIIGWDDNFPKESFAGETYVTPYGQYDLPSSYRTLSIGSSVTISGSDESSNWLVFSPTEDGDYTFYSTSGSTDPYAILYQLGSNGLLAQIARNDDGPTGYDFSITASLYAGETYYLDCEDYNTGASYTVYVVLDSSGGGDDVDGSIDVPSSSTQIFEGSPVTVQTESWLSFTPSEDGLYTFQSSDASGDPKATLYAQSTTNGLLYELTTDDDGAGNRNFSIVYNLSAGRTYYLDCYSYDGDSIAYSVTVTMDESGGEDGDVYPPTSWIEIAAGDSVSVSSGDWLRFTPSTSGSYTFSSTDCGDYDPVVTLYQVSSSNGLLRSIGDNDDGGEGYNFSLTDRLNAGTTYFLYCGVYGGSSAAYTVSVSSEQSGGSLEPPSSALPIAVGSPQTVSTGGTTTEWLRFTPSKDGSYTFSGSSTAGYDITVYGVASNGLLGYIDDAYSRSSGSYSYSVNMKSSITYYLKCTVSSGQSFDISATYAGAPVVKGPSEDGAWLVRNSWGEYWGDSGYFWVSYEDTSMNGTPSSPNVATIFECEPADNYDNIYQYDGTCNIAYTYLSSGGSVANIFEAEANDGGDELIQAVSFWLEDVNVNYSVQIYTGLTSDSDPTSGTAQLSTPATGKTSYEGYYTVVLPQDVRVSAGEKFSVVVTVSHDDDSSIWFGFDESGDWTWAFFTSSCLPGQSFARRSSSSSWCDTGLYEWDDYGNVRLKAFTSNTSGSGGISISDATVTCNPATYEYTGSAITPSVTVTLNGTTLRQGSDYTFSCQNNTDVGTATVVVTGRGSYRGTARGSFTITKAKVTPPTAVTGLVYSGSSQRGVPAGTGYQLSGTYSATDAGTYSATATLTNTSNYMWSDGTTAAKTISWSIARASISNATVSTIADQIYTGSALTPRPTVRFNSMTLTQGTDYTLSYSNNTNVGTARVTITGTGNFSGTKSATFNIVEPAVGPFFLDADPADTTNHGAEVDWMGRSGISMGWEVAGGREYRGLEQVTRCDFAAFLYRMADLADDGARNDSIRLTDEKVESVLSNVADCTPKTDHAAEIAWLISTGISRGWQNSDGTLSFRPYAKVARQDMAAFLYRFADLQDDKMQNQSPEPGPERVTFSDVVHGDDANHASEVEWLASVGVTKGWDMHDGTYQFRGTNIVARQDMAAFMYRLYTYLQG